MAHQALGPEDALKPVCWNRDFQKLLHHFEYLTACGSPREAPNSQGGRERNMTEGKDTVQVKKEHGYFVKDEWMLEIGLGEVWPTELQRPLERRRRRVPRSYEEKNYSERA